MTSYVNYLNITGKNYYVYDSPNDQNQIVGCVYPAFLDVERLTEIKVPRTNERVCKLVGGPCEPSRKRSLYIYPDHEYYISDYLWLACNYTCPYCLTDSPEYTRSTHKFFIKPDVRLKWLEYMSEKIGPSRYVYRLFGGEPTIYPRFTDLIDFFNKDKKCVICNISTNAHETEPIEHFLRADMNKDKFTLFIAIHPMEPKFDWTKTKKHILQIFEANYTIFLIGVSTSKTNECLHRYSKELTKESGLEISIFDNLRPEKLQ